MVVAAFEVCSWGPEEATEDGRGLVEAGEAAGDIGVLDPIGPVLVFLPSRPP